MKFIFVAFVCAGAVIVVYGSPFAGERPLRAHYYEAPQPILPMSFAHADHVAENCIACHHNYVDDTGGGPCMGCHVTNRQVWPLLERQFHDLCRGCHEDRAASGDAGGPPRRCIECHRGGGLP